MKSSMDQSTWHDQKPSHRTTSQAEITARQTEQMAWDASDWILEKAHETRDPDEKDLYYDAHQRMQFAAECAGESLRRAKRQIIP